MIHLLRHRLHRIHICYFPLSLGVKDEPVVTEEAEIMKIDERNPGQKNERRRSFRKILPPDANLPLSQDNINTENLNMSKSEPEKMKMKG